MPNACVKAARISFDFSACVCHHAGYCVGDFILVTLAFVLAVLLPIIVVHIYCRQDSPTPVYNSQLSFVGRPLRGINTRIDMLVDTVSTRPPRPAKSAKLTSSLPPELRDIILSHFNESQDTLLKCTLICRAWSRPSRACLCLTLDRHDRMTELGRLLRSRCETLSGVRHVLLDGCIDDLGQQERILRLMRMKRAKLKTIVLRRESIKLSPVLFRHHPTVEQISFHSDSSISARSLDLLSDFDHLRRLELRSDVGLLDYGKADVGKTLCVTHLVVTGGWNDDLMSWLQMRCRNLEILDAPAHEKLRWIIRSNWRTLRRVGLKVVFADLKVSLNLDVLQSLEVVDLRLWSRECVGVAKRMVMNLPKSVKVIIHSKDHSDVIQLGRTPWGNNDGAFAHTQVQAR